MSIAGLINYFFSALTWLIFGRVILSWVVRDPYNPVVNLVHELTEPILAPIRSILPRTGGLDFSPFLAILLIRVLHSIALELLRYRPF